MNTKETVEENSENYYDVIARGYEELHNEEQQQKLRIIKQKLPQNFFEQVNNLLDVGCGSGISTRSWKNLEIKRTGIDPSKELIKIAKTKDDAKYFVCGAEELPFEESEFDVVASLTAIQNFTDLTKGLQEIKRVGKNKFILTVLKKAQNSLQVKKMINELFEVKQFIEEDKDYMFLIYP